MKRIYIIIGVALLLLASCTQQRAKSVAKDFMAAYISDDADYLDFSAVDSTRAISDSLVQVLRQRGPKGANYQERTSKTLYLLRAKYLLDEDTCSTTFYMNPDMAGVVAVKNN